MRKKETNFRLYVAIIIALTMLPAISFASGMVNTGTFIAAGGSIDIASGLDNTGTLSGTAGMTGNVTNSGNISPGNPPDAATGTLTLDGDLTLTGMGRIYIDINGIGQYDQLAVTGSASLDGTLELGLGAGFNPSDGDNFTIMTYSGKTGAFSNVILPSNQWAVVFGPSSISLTYDITAPETSILTGPSGTISTTTAEFGFTSNEAGTFRCKIDSGAYESCTSPVIYNNLSAGSHTFSVYAVDRAGNPDPSPSSRTWTVAMAVQPFKIGIFDHGTWYLDSNQSWAWDGTPSDTLGVFGIGLTGAIPVVGDWNGDGSTKIGVFIDGTWYLDANRSWVWDGEPEDRMGAFGVGITGALPVVGDWNGNGITKIGVYADGLWYLDLNNNWQWDGEPTDTMGVFGVGLTNALPVVGDWDGDGISEIGIYSDGVWYLDVNRSWQWDGEPTDTMGIFGIGLTNSVPVTGDWNADGISEIGIYQEGIWYLDVNRSWAWDGEPADTMGVFGVGLTDVMPVPGRW